MPNTIVTIDSSGEQYAMWDLQTATGIGVSSPGLIMGGHIGGDFETKRFEGIAQFESDRAMLNEYTAAYNVHATVDSKPLLLNSLRGSAQKPPLLKISAGSPKMGWAMQNAIINSAKWSFSGLESSVDFNFDLLALSGSIGSGIVTQAALGGPVMTANQAIVTIGGTDFVVMKAEGEIRNNFKVQSHAGTKTIYRDPTHYEPGREEHTVRLTLRKPYTGIADPTVDVPGTVGLVVVLIDGAGGTVTLTYSGLSVNKNAWRNEFKSSGPVDFDFNFIGPKGCLVIS